MQHTNPTPTHNARVSPQENMGASMMARTRPSLTWARRAAALAALALGLGSSLAVAQSVYSGARQSSFTYRADGLLDTETVEPGNPQLCVQTKHEYDPRGNKVKVTTSSCGATGLAAFDPRSNTSTFNAADLVQTIKVEGSDRNVSLAAGLFATTSANALNHSETKNVDPRFGVATKLVGPNGLATSWDYDDFGRKIRETRADGTKTEVYHCLVGPGLDASANSAGCGALNLSEKPAGAVMLVHSEPHKSGGGKMGPFVRVYSDAMGRELRSATESFDGSTQPTNVAGSLIVKDTFYDAYGTKVVETQPYFLKTGSSVAQGSGDKGLSKTEYDRLGRPKAVYVTDPSGSVNHDFGFGLGTRRAALQTVEYTGLSTTSTNDKGQRRLEERNVNGQVVRVTDAAGASLAHQHDAFGNLIETKDALQNRILITYDIRGRKKTLQDPDAGLTTYEYNALGELVWQQNANQRAAGTVTTLAYDTLGRLKTRADPEYTSNWAYDTCNKGTGKLCATSTSHGISRKIVYDSLVRPSSSRTDVSGGPSLSSALSYEANTGRLATQTYPTGVQVAYGYTIGLGFLNQLKLNTAANGKTLSTGSVLWQANIVNAWGKTESSWTGNGITSRATYNALTGRTEAISAGAGAAATNVLNHTYQWDSINNLTGRTDWNGDAVAGAVQEAFVYGDPLNRLTGYSVSAQAVPNSRRDVTLQYNALGMVLSKSDVGAYSYGPQGAGQVRPHALQSVDGSVKTNYSYDHNGNLVSASDGKYRSIAYTSFNLPDSNQGAQGPNGLKYTWQYDENQARIRETRVNGSGTRTTWNLHPDKQGGLGFEREEGSNGVASNRHYLSVGGQAIGVLITTGALPALAAAQTEPPAISGSVAVVKMEFWHKDHLGSLAATTDHTGAVTARYSYDPFGKRRHANGRYDDFGTIVVDWNSGTDNGTDRGYTGHEHLDDIGLIHMNGRIFDPNLGVFLQVDPLIQDQFNLQNYFRYGYCHNNPLTCTDPTGYKFSFKKLLK
ncbi:MAG: RHS repeat-associated core domain-containing protein, partial [Paucibacter sp.]|nr:RHS repeat-associated core domain-containing protein [Roseateles sp.]